MVVHPHAQVNYKYVRMLLYYCTIYLLLRHFARLFLLQLPSSPRLSACAHFPPFASCAGLDYSCLAFSLSCVGLSSLCITETKTKQWAADLEKLCLETADERTCLEATAYSAWMSGNLLLEREAWREALDRYSTAHRICQELGKVRLTAFVDVKIVSVA